MQEILNIFKALSDQTRLRVLKLLEHGELCVCDIFSALDMVQPKVSFHLSVLKEAGLIADRKEGRWVHYRIDDSDLFRRFLILTAFERISEDDVKDDKERLELFLKSKNNHADRSDSSVAIMKKSTCCGR
jgi:ArsR family transcriptional regulator, arsenate/arsenite/antimonite-responsive transcriptional repressor